MTELADRNVRAENGRFQHTMTIRKSITNRPSDGGGDRRPASGKAVGKLSLHRLPAVHA
ncbi:hypothetical protein I546_2022 [Mycobacterium kansasii 732]|nr:hypothetical protein I546_2022 [Mycobacterium kansasii 732]